MYSACLSCHAPLGANEMLERFPVGRKLAIDATKGRLWVVCTICAQWNLSPLEERWEAIEEGERLYRDTRLRTSTDNIGLARLKDGSELIRIGPALRPEFAAWRYGERFRRRFVLNAPGAAVAGAGGLVLKSAGGVGVLGAIGYVAVPLLALSFIGIVSEVTHQFRRIVTLDLPSGERAKLTLAHIETLRFLADPTTPAGWQLRFRHAPTAHQRRHHIRHPEVIVRGAEALRYAMRLLPRVNRIGGRKRSVEEAVAILEQHGSPDAVFRFAGGVDPSSVRTAHGLEPQPIAFAAGAERSAFVLADPAVRLAVEMAAHEEQERALLAGELGELERQWKEADEIAGIADSLTLPPIVLKQLERLRMR